MKLSSHLHIVQALALGTLMTATTACSVGERNLEGAKYPATDAGAQATQQPSLRKQLKAVKTYAKTTLQLTAVEEAQLAGLDVQGRSAGSTQPPVQMSQLRAAAGQSGNVPLHLRLRLEARNPNRDKVLLNQLEYVVLVDNREVARGTTEDALEIGPRSILAIPLTVDANVRPTITAGLTPEAMASAITNWSSKPGRLSIRVRPTFQNEAGRAFRTTEFEPIEASAATR